MKLISGWKKTVGSSKPRADTRGDVRTVYLFTDPELREIREIIEEVQRRNETFKAGEIFPTDRAPALIQKNSITTPEVLAWGFPNFRNKGVIINARA